MHIFYKWLFWIGHNVSKNGFERFAWLLIVTSRFSVVSIMILILSHFDFLKWSEATSCMIHDHWSIPWGDVQTKLPYQLSRESKVRTNSVFTPIYLERFQLKTKGFQVLEKQIVDWYIIKPKLFMQLQSLAQHTQTQLPLSNALNESQISELAPEISSKSLWLHRGLFQALWRCKILIRRETSKLPIKSKNVTFAAKRYLIGFL